MMDSQKTHRFDREDISRLQAELMMAAGNLKLSGGASKVVEADIHCSDESWQPSVNYSAEEGVGRLTMHQDFGEQKGFRFFERRRNDWTVNFQDEIPLALMVELNASKADFALSSLQMTSLDLATNAGKINLDLTGEHPDLGGVYIEANATLIDAALHGAFPKLKLIDMELSAVKATLDLTGDWTHSQDFSIEANAGLLKLRLPRHVGIRIFKETTMTLFKHTGFRKSGGALVNDAYEESPVTLSFDIEANVGRVELEIVDKIPVTV